jgi:hypothetical protein
MEFRLGTGGQAQGIRGGTTSDEFRTLSFLQSPHLLFAHRFILIASFVLLTAVDDER